MIAAERVEEGLQEVLRGALNPPYLRQARQSGERGGRRIVSPQRSVTGTSFADSRSVLFPIQAEAVAVQEKL